MSINLVDLLAAGGRLFGPPQATQFADWSYDSRLTELGACFIALRTLRADGHDYIPAALAAGATGVLCSRPPRDPGQATVIVADDPQALLQRWASAHLAALAPTVVAVTGSVGKTSARRAIAAVLAAHAPTFQSRRSFNSLLGLPIALARLEAEQRFAVLEFGSDRRGEIARLAALFPPQIAVITAIGEAHLRSFGSLTAIAAEKGDLPAALPPNGIAILNADDHLVRALSARTQAHIFRFGAGVAADLRGELMRTDLRGSLIRLHYGGTSLQAWAPLIGAPALTTALAAVAVGLNCGGSLETAAAALASIEPPAGRLRPFAAHNGATIIDDSFSATLPSMRAALTTLASMPARRRIAVLAPPLDLPPGDEERSYRELGELAAYCADWLILKGDWGVIASRAARAVRPEVPVEVVDTTAAAVMALPDDCGPGDLILVKGAAAARMERVVAALLADAERQTTDSGTDFGLQPHLYAGRGAPGGRAELVRQEPAWRSVRVGQPDRPTWLRIDLDAIAGNVRALQTFAGVPLMAVLKGDAYGHGAVRVARAASRAGAYAMAVATIGEARMLRTADIAGPILVLGYTAPWQAHEAARLGLACTVFDHEAALALSAAGVEHDHPLPVHVKVDTGMGRLGLPPAEVGPFLAWMQTLPGLALAGLYTHFADADLPDSDYTSLQHSRFTGLLTALEAAGLRPPLVHAANSAAALRLPNTRFDLIRPGIALYGLAPGPDIALPPGFQPALSFHSEVAQVREHPAGTPLSYGGAFVTQRPSLIATIPVGYADGLRRSPPWRAVLVRGQRAPLVGRICMDYALLDVSDIPDVKRGDAVVLLGTQGAERISADEVAGWLGTISYEVLTSILPRVPREIDE
jgi:Alr-MurF fusion protein